MANHDEDEETIEAGESEDDEGVPFLDQGSETGESDNLLGAPRDRWKRVYIVFYLLGMGTLLPWNFFISVNSFWDYKFRDLNKTLSTSSWQGGGEKTEMQKDFTAYLAIASNVPNATFVILNAIFGQRFSLRRRIFGSLIVVIVLFMTVMSLSISDSDSWQREFMVIVLLLVVVININTAIFQGGVFGAAGRFPPSYIGTMMSGQAMGGIFPAVVGLIVVAANIKPKDSGFASFMTATVVLIICFFSLIWVTQNSFFKFYAERDARSDEDDNSEIVSKKIIVARSWQYGLGVFIIFSTTLAIFPAVAVLIVSQYQGTVWSERYFTPVTCFLLFNCGDYLGRILVSGNWVPGKNKVLIVCMLRTFFIPLFLLCNASPETRSLPVLIPYDGAYIFLMLAFSVSNGFLANLCMINGPKTSSSRECQEATAMMLVACLVVGTATGSFLSYPLEGAI